MELMFQDLKALLPVLGGYEYVEGSLDVVCKFFPYRDVWVNNMQKRGTRCNPLLERITWRVILYLTREMDRGREVAFRWY